MKNKLGNKKGITLIALVITIIVLLILAGISITMVSSQDGILKKATSAKETQEKATEVEKVKLAVQAAMVNENGTVDKGELNKQLNKLGYDPVNDLPADIEISGEKYTIASNGEVEPKTLKVGDEVTYEGENFYVIGGDAVGTEISSSTQKVILLAKYNLKKEDSEITFKQDTTGTSSNACAFSDDSYWSSEPEESYPLDLNNYKLNDSEVQAKIKSTDAIEVAKRYGSILGAIGRLMTYEEANKLKTVNSTILYGEDRYLNYWLGSASGEGSVGYNSGV